MKKLSYSFYDTKGINGGAITELAAIFEKNGLKPVGGEFGGGEQVKQIIAWLNINWDIIAINLLSAYIVKILDDLWEWHKTNHFQKQKTIPVVNITIYIKNKISITQEYPINKKYSEEEIKIIENLTHFN